MQNFAIHLTEIADEPLKVFLRFIYSSLCMKPSVFSVKKL